MVQTILGSGGGIGIPLARFGMMATPTEEGIKKLVESLR